MKPKFKLKKWVVISVYIMTLGAIVSSLYLVGKTLKEAIYADETLSYVYKGIFDTAIPVVNYTNDTIIKPFTAEVKELKTFYDKDAEKEAQEKSLILYENTYMPNTGILYGSDTSFDVIAPLDGTVENIVSDEIMGNIVTIKHSNNLSTVYHSLNEVKVLIGNVIKQGDVIGNSGCNKIESSSENMLLFEVIQNGEYINPNKFYELKIDELQ